MHVLLRTRNLDSSRSRLRQSLVCIALFAVANLLLSVCAWAAEGTKTEADTFTFGQRLILPSKVLGEEREVLIHLPRDYAKSQQRYPVLFILDGDKHFDYASGVVDYLARTRRAPSLILVAIPSLQTRRRDLTMPVTLDKKLDKRMREDKENNNRLYGGADGFLRFMADELAPWVDAHYRTEPYRVLSGHSLGGLFNFYALLQRPDAFQAHIAVSPSLWWDERAWVKQAKEKLVSLPGHHRLYFSWGDYEPTIRDSSQELVDWMGEQELPGLEWKARYYPGDDHGTTPLRTLYDGLEWLYAGWSPKLPGGKNWEYAELKRRIGDHYAGLSQRYGYPIEPGASVLERLSQWLLEKERYDEALAEARANLAAHPDEIELHDHISHILEKQGRAAEALAEYKLSLRDVASISEANQRRLERLERKAVEQGKAGRGMSSKPPPTL